jgi:regulator of protease activity HflC (stomatin/prohibitin superfamily)
MAGLLLALLGAFAWGHHRGYVAGASSVQALWDADTARRTREALAAEQAARAEEQRRAEAQKEVERETQRLLDRAEADRLAAVAAADGVRQRAQRLAAQCGAAPVHPGAAGGGQAAEGPGLVLADVLSRIDGRAGELAAAYDRARAAGLACERAYNALTASP